ncbi:MAG: structural protein [Alphaproteobacteria bacterium]|nr:structural protein [Alphaproteobacteria bacterium]
MTDIFIPRGIRNNNPGNLRLSKTRWQGQAAEQPDPDFITFMGPVFGLRALMKTLLTYRLKYGLDTVRSLINRYAPPVENDTGSYIYNVAKRLGVKPDDEIDLCLQKTLVALAAAIVCHENGRPPQGRVADWYDASVYAQAAVLAQKEDA